MTHAIRLLTLTLAVGCAHAIGPDEPEGRSKEEIVAGTAHSGDPAVVYLQYTSDGLCTGALIGPRAVLTARHCIRDPNTGAEHRPVAVGTGPAVAGGSRYANVVDIRMAEGPIVGNDIAVLLLDRAGTLTPYPWAADRPPTPGARVIGIGYGDTDTDRFEAGTKRRGESTVGEVMERELVTGGALSCHGDSGGPAFDMEGRIVGVVSRGTAERCSTGSTIYTRTDAHRAFIAAALEASGSADAPAPSEPAPSEPAPSEPAPGEPAPADPGPGEPAPSEPPPPGPADSGTSLCTELCPYSGDGECDDGGPGALTCVCPWGTDCMDCGPRSAAPGPGTPSPSGGCSDTCPWAFDGACDDGSAGAMTSWCAPGTDCADCGGATEPASPPREPGY